VHAAPGRHAVEVADIVSLRQLEELWPGQTDWVVAEAADLETPRVERDVRGIAEVEDRPVRNLTLSEGQFRHAVPVARAAAVRGPAVEGDVDALLVQLALAL